MTKKTLYTTKLSTKVASEVANNPILSLENVSFRFNNKVPLFFDTLTCSFARSIMHFIRGKNGVGKSTLFKILAGQIDQENELTGTIILDNQVITLADRILYRTTTQTSVRMVQQQISSMLAPSFSVANHLAMAQLNHYPRLARLPRITVLPTLLQQLGIPPEQPVGKLSGGQKQIVAISMIVQQQTKILLLDEPTAALDSTNTQLVMHYLQKIMQEQEITMIIISHDSELIEQYAPEAYYVLNDSPQGKTITYEQYKKNKLF